jgi:hypothetical protein
MITQQKGFFFAIFASSIMLSSVLIFSFIAFVFRNGFIQPNAAHQHTQNYELMHNYRGPFENATMWNNPGWSGKFSMGAIQSILHEEGKFLWSLSKLVVDSALSFSRYRGPIYNWNTQNISYADPRNYRPDYVPAMYENFEFGDKIMISYGPNNDTLLVSKNTLRNEEMHALY